MKKQQTTAKKSAASSSVRGVVKTNNTSANTKKSAVAASTHKVPSRAGKAGTPARSTTAAIRKTAAAKPQPTTATPAAPAPELYSSIHALLHTMRVIERHEEPLCSMQDELKRTGRLSALHRRKLQQLVEELPAEIYQHDLQNLRRAVGV